MRRVLEHVVLLVGFPILDFSDLLADRDHRLAESIELLLRLAFRRLDHEGARHRERHGRRVESIVHQPLGDILDIYSARLLHYPRVDDALVRHRSVCAFVQHREMRLQSLRDVIRIEDCDLRRVLQPIAAHQLDVGVRDRQNARASPWSR